MSDEEGNISKKHQNYLKEMGERVRIGECSKHRTTFQGRIEGLKILITATNKRIEALEKPFELLKGFQQGYIDRIINLEEVLREHINQHWKIADADRDDLNIIHSWKGKLILLLEKLEPKEKTEPEKDYVRFVRNYEGYWKSEYDKLIEKFQDDLDEVIAWANNYPKDSEIYIRLKRKREKWQGKIK